jgi:hypothetical protein
MKVPLVIAAGVLVAVSACSAGGDARGTRAAPPPPGAASEPATVGSAGPTSAVLSGVPSADPAEPAAVRFLDAGTACAGPGGGPLEFGIALSNPGGSDYSDIAPLVTAEQYPGGAGPLHVVAATLERRDPATGTWRPVPLPAVGSDQALSADWPPMVLPHGRTVELRYRLTAAPEAGAGQTRLHAYALRQSDHRALAEAVRPLCFA